MSLTAGRASLPERLAIAHRAQFGPLTQIARDLADAVVKNELDEVFAALEADGSHPFHGQGELTFELYEALAGGGHGDFQVEAGVRPADLDQAAEFFLANPLEAADGAAADRLSSLSDADAESLELILPDALAQAFAREGFRVVASQFDGNSVAFIVTCPALEQSVEDVKAQLA